MDSRAASASSTAAGTLLAEENVSEDGVGLQRCLENLQALKIKNQCFI